MSYPLSDPLSWTGLRECPRMPSVRKPKLVSHPPHTCSDGTVVVVLSQVVTLLPDRTLDRWIVGEEEVATSARTTEPGESPDFGWFAAEHGHNVPAVSAITKELAAV